MFDYLLNFETPEARAAAYPAPEGAPASWQIDGVSIVPVVVWVADPAGDTVDSEGRPVRGRVASPGFWLGLASDEPITPRPANTIVEMERPDTPTYWKQCIRWARPEQEFAPVIAVEPTFAGSDYISD